jgi:hypothetical protein
LGVADELLDPTVPAATRAVVVRDILTRCGIGKGETINLTVADSEGAKERLMQRLSGLAAAGGEQAARPTINVRTERAEDQ